jgi:CHAT domain-containing protein
VEDHIFEDFALFLAHEEPPDLARALRVGEIGRVGGLRELYRLRGLPAPSWADQELSVADLGRRAGAETAVLVYQVGSHAAALVCLRADDLRVFPLAPPQELERAAEVFARTAFDLTARDAELERAGQRAYELLLAPAAEALAGVKRLVLVGAGRFGRMPFAALVVPGEEALARRHLAQRFELAFAPTLGALTAARAAPAAGRSVSLGCDGAGTFAPELVAHFGLGGLARLTRAEAEAKAVARALGGRAVHGREATEEAFRQAARAPGILHFAGHALVDDVDGTKSALVLAPPAEAGGDDGLLTLGELLELPIEARLVILSACRTARGETFAGEGVGGMARCLLAAGARNLLLTLAPLDDAKAPVFLAHFSAALAEGASPAAALARAQRRMLAKKTDAHPAFWASFALYGQEDLLR